MEALPINGKEIQRDRGFVHLPGEGQVVSMMGVSITFKAICADTQDAWSLVEYTAPPHYSGPPLHWHKQTLEGFYILSGTITFQMEEQIIKAPAGTFILVPPGTLHKFSNEESVPATFLTLFSPGGLEQFFLELAELMQVETTWPPADMSGYNALIAKHDLYPPCA